jgi:3-dehydroquinate synthetase
VLVDPTALATLPADQLRAGMAEAIKHGAISDQRLFDETARFAATAMRSGVIDWSSDETSRLIARSIAVKASVVRQDERESGMRQLLNAGHTVAHAIELVSGFRYLHGEAVSIGLVAETWLAERAGVAQEGTALRLSDALGGAGLPTRLPADLPVAGLLGAMQSDKKARAGRLAFAFLAEIGRPAGNVDRGWTTFLDASTVAAWLEEFAAA